MANKQKVKFGPGIEGFAKRGLASALWSPATEFSSPA